MSETFVIPQGPVKLFDDEAMAPSMEPTLRQLGVHSKLTKGVVENRKEHVVCKEGDILTSEQARLLKMFNQFFSTFRFDLHCVYSNGEVEYMEGHHAGQLAERVAKTSTGGKHVSAMEEEMEEDILDEGEAVLKTL